MEETHISFGGEVTAQRPPTRASAASAAAAAPEGGGDSAGAEGGSGRKLPRSTLHRALRRRMAVRMAGLVFLLVFWVLVGACQRNGAGGFLLFNSSSSSRKRPRLMT